MIRAYPSEPTVEGNTLTLHVATDAPSFRVRFYRQGESFQALADRGSWLPGHDVPSRACGERWNWPAYSFQIPAAWPPGVYVAECIETERAAPLPSADARAGTTLFVLRRAGSARIVVNLPLFTYHAYNIAAVDGTCGDDQGACLYSGYRTVSLHRPGGGTGGHTWDARNADVYDTASPRQTFAHWDAKALAWLAKSGYAVDVCTDLDLHRGRLADDVRLLLAFGHQEYWTRPMRRTVENHLARGGNVAFFSGNTAWFRVQYAEDQATLTRDGRWCDDEPEERFSGVSYRFGGGWWRGPRPPLGYQVRAASHWVFAGTGLRDGDVFGADERLVGYECDGLSPDAGLPVLAGAALDDWRERLACGDGGGDGEVLGDSAAMLLCDRQRGTVFNAGTVDWPRVLDAGEPTVGQITRNVIERLGASGSPLDIRTARTVPSG